MKYKIKKRYLPALSKIFTPIVLDSLAQNGTSNYLDEVVTNSGILNQLQASYSLRHFFDWVYDLLLKNYRNEYIYKNAIANKILLGRHSLNTSHMLTEFRVANCKADVVILNGTSTVYEIKSEFDSFYRLENQIESYRKIFNHINVITSNSQLKKLYSKLPDGIGIMILTDRNTIKVVRNSRSQYSHLNAEVIFNSLRKNEYTAIIKEFYGNVPDVPNTQIYKVCKELFITLPVDQLHDSMVQHLSYRKNSKLLQEFVKQAPSSLTAYALSGSATNKNIQNLIPLFKKPFKTILIPSIA